MNSNAVIRTGIRKGQSKSGFLSNLLYYKYFYLMLIPVVIHYIIFCYTPMYGATLAFKSYDFSKGILGSPWIGLQNFKDILHDHDFWVAFKNTIIISCGKLLINFPSPIILAILLNELVNAKIKKVYQTVFTFPHFVTWVVLSGIVINIFGNNGIYNQIIAFFGGQPNSPLLQANTFRPLLYLTHMWKEIGWDSIIYLAALSGINADQYEAATIDGANRFQKIVYVSWPGIRGTAAILLILAVGNAMKGGESFEQIFNLYSAPVYSVADIIDTYVFRQSFSVGMNFGYTTAMGFLKSIISLFLLWLANASVKKMGENGLF